MSADGVTFTTTSSTVDVRAWQLVYPARRVIETKEAKVVFSLAQWMSNGWSEQSDREKEEPKPMSSPADVVAFFTQPG